jgi:hypothetical protein
MLVRRDPAVLAEPEPIPRDGPGQARRQVARCLIIDADAPGVTKSMRVTLNDLGLAQIFVVYPGRESYRLDPKVEVVSILDLVKTLRRARMTRESPSTPRTT